MKLFFLLSQYPLIYLSIFVDVDPVKLKDMRAEAVELEEYIFRRRLPLEWQERQARIAQIESAVIGHGESINCLLNENYSLNFLGNQEEYQVGNVIIYHFHCRGCRCESS